MSIASRTEHKKLFDQVYWGRFNEPPRDDGISNAIIENRNRFVADYGIMRVPPASRLWSLLNQSNDSNKFDHPEFYETCTKRIVFVSSNYGSEASAYRDDMQVIAKLYHEKCITVCRVFETMGDAVAWFKSLRDKANNKWKPI
jgi:hypothetical protein